MSAKPSPYILESESESERLDRQSKMRVHDFRPELQFLRVSEGSQILDAGCGSGIVSDHLSRLAPGVKVTGWDASAERMEAARKKYDAERIEFIQQDVLRPTDDRRFDVIVCRYVLHHMKAADARKAVRNLAERLAPGGTLYCINVEGLMDDVYPSSPSLLKALAKIRSAREIDLQAARKVPSLLVEEGLEMDWQVLTTVFKGADLVEETANLKETLRNAQKFVEGRLGGKAARQRFEKEYFETLAAPGCALYYNKVVAIGTKPARLRLVKA